MPIVDPLYRLQFGWPIMSFQSLFLIAACPINREWGGFRLINISLQGVSLFSVIIGHALYPSNAHLSLSNSKPTMPSTIVGS